jgi:hypothetical protein
MPADLMGAPRWSPLLGVEFVVDGQQFDLGALGQVGGLVEHEPCTSQRQCAAAKAAATKKTLRSTIRRPPRPLAP